jgi:hypothetical protein
MIVRKSRRLSALPPPGRGGPLRAGGGAVPNPGTRAKRDSESDSEPEWDRDSESDTVTVTGAGPGRPSPPRATVALPVRRRSHGATASAA